MECTPTRDISKSATPRIGVGFRSPHLNEILESKPKLDFFELLTDNHLAEGGSARQQAFAIRHEYPVTMHCVGMSLGGTDPIDFKYLGKIKNLAKELEPVCISDHLCWTSFTRQHANDLLPLPYTDEAVMHVGNRINQIQDFLETTLVVENVSSYLEFECSTLKEWEFLIAVEAETKCKLLLDINNVYVSQFNNNIDANEYLRNIPLHLVAEIHLAGFEDKGTYLLDAHNNRVSAEVWNLFQKVAARDNSIPTLIEWDNDIPAFSTLLSEAKQARKYLQHAKDSREINEHSLLCKAS